MIWLAKRSLSKKIKNNETKERERDGERLAVVKIADPYLRGIEGLFRWSTSLWAPLCYEGIPQSCEAFNQS